MKDTLCLFCTKPGKRLCSWDDSKGEIPVKGWKAEKSAISYRVIDCPLFEEDQTAESRMPPYWRTSSVEDEDILFWHEQGLTQQEIGNIVGMAKSTITFRIAKMKKEGKINE